MTILITARPSSQFGGAMSRIGFGVLNKETNYAEMIKKRKPIKGFCDSPNCVNRHDCGNQRFGYHVRGLSSIAIEATSIVDNCCKRCGRAAFWSSKYSDPFSLHELLKQDYARKIAEGIPK